MVMVLDDNGMDLEMIERKFKAAGIKKYKLFSTCEEFLKNIDGSVNVMVIDHNLGNKQFGIDVMKQAIELNPICYPIILSGQERPETILDYFNNDAFRYIRKRDENCYDLVVKYVLQAQKRIDFVSKYFTH